MSGKRSRRLAPSKKEKPPKVPTWSKSESAAFAATNSLARWCKLTATQRTATNDAQQVTWDSSKLQCSLTKGELADNLLLRNLAHGHIVSGRFWPVLIEESNDDLVKFRSLGYLKSLSSLPELDEDQTVFLCVAVRDLWLANARGLLSDPLEKALLDRMMNLLDEEALPGAELKGLGFSFCPTRHRRVLKWMNNLHELLSDASSGDTRLIDSVAQLSSTDDATEAVYAVWVDARDLSYHNFECIVPLDRVLRLCVQPASLKLALTAIKPMHPTLVAFEAQLTGNDCDLLLQLDQLGLYQRPANSATRGGERFIFSSVVLSNAITEAVKASGLIAQLEEKGKPPVDTSAENLSKKKKVYSQESLSKPKHAQSEFVMCNYVFRCNRFVPGDGKFEKHLDTPYHDAAREHISKYTIIIYLSSGEGDPALCIEGSKPEERLVVKKLNQLQVVVFDQRYEHEGKPFVAGNKIFLRSELVFKERNLAHDSHIAPLFSSAVYLTTESAFQPELARYAHELYERVNHAHWGHPKGKPLLPLEAPVLLKRWQDSNLVFGTNGYDYWFPCTENKQAQAAHLKLCALVAVLDHFNATYEEQAPKKVPRAAGIASWQQRRLDEKFTYEKQLVAARKNFKKECTISPLKSTGAATPASVLSILWKHINAKKASQSQAIRPISKEEKETVFTKILNADRWKDDDSENNDEKEHEQACCLFHNGDDPFVPWKCDDVIEAYEAACKYSRQKLLGAPLILLDKELRFDEEAILIVDDKIFLTSDAKGGEPLRINFAACWNVGSPAGFLTNEAIIPAPRFMLPPIPFVILPATTDAGPGFRLMLDFFNNDFCLYSKNEFAAALGRQIPVPGYSSECEDEDRAASDYLRIVNPSLSHFQLAKHLHGPESEDEGEQDY